MPQVDFYIIKDNHPYQFAWRLIEKIYSKKHQVLIQVDSTQQAKFIDDTLWTYQDIQFIPHALLQDKIDAPILICQGDEPSNINDVLVNFSGQVPSRCHQFKRIIEIVANDENWKKISRTHFSFYKTQNFEIKTHQL